MQNVFLHCRSVLPDMKKLSILSFILLTSFLFNACEEGEERPKLCPDNQITNLTERNFEMGFSTWPFGPDAEDADSTYQFIANNADIYSEQIDASIPWSAWINNTALPEDFTGSIAYRKSKRPANLKLLLSVSLLNTDRSDLSADIDGTVPEYTAMNDAHIEEAYFKHLTYLVDEMNPDYLVMAMEVNELYLKSETKWNEYLGLIHNIRSRMKERYPDLPLSESVTLHNWYDKGTPYPASFLDVMKAYVNQSDFAAISFYPFLEDLRKKGEFQQAFDFLHNNVTRPIALVETTHLAENLEIPKLETSIKTNVCDQKEYLETLLTNAHNNDYLFIIWWAHRDYDELWETFPGEVKDVAQIWRDTGLLDEDGEKRPAYEVWEYMFDR